jgi:hypothetical protein
MTMNPSQAAEQSPRPRRWLAADWTRLSEAAQAQAVAIARHEGRRAARWYLAEVPSGCGAVPSLRNSRWAAELAGLDQLDDQLLHLYASAHALPCEVDYVTYIVEPYCPERIGWWWRIPRERRVEDPRVCAFCEAYERERCHLLGLAEPPTTVAELEQYLAAARERERASGRAWLRQAADPDRSEEEDTAERVARCQHLYCLLATDLAQMLRDAARFRAEPAGTGGDGRTP